MTSQAPAFSQLEQSILKTPGGDIACPHCGGEISLTEALRTQFAEKFEKEFKRKEQVAASLIKQKEEFLARKAATLETVFKEKEKVLQIEALKKFEGEKAKLVEDVSKRIAEDQRFKIAEKDKQLDSMKRTIEELKRKSEITSQQLQGEVLELELEATLKRFCITDEVEPVAKGVRGGDIIHKVISGGGTHVGTIVWETKRTKAWSEGWIDKIKEDQRAIAAECAVIVSDVLPKGISSLGFHYGVWVCDTKTVLGLATVLRLYLLQVSSAKVSVAGKDVKMEIMYRYLTGTQFAQNIQAMVETFKEMQGSIQTEKRALQKIWASREQHLERMILNTASIYGSVQGIVGGALPRIEALEIGVGDQLTEKID